MRVQNFSHEPIVAQISYEKIDLLFKACIVYGRIMRRHDVVDKFIEKTISITLNQMVEHLIYLGLVKKKDIVLHSFSASANVAQVPAIDSSKDLIG